MLTYKNYNFSLNQLTFKLFRIICNDTQFGLEEAC